MHDKPKNRDWVKNAAIIFLAVLLVLTFFSNTIMNRSLPEVATQGVTDGSIVARVRGTGTVVANSNTQVKMEKTRVIRSVLVKVGQQVQAGDVLFTLGEGSSEDIDAAEDKLRQLQTSYNRTAATMPEFFYAADNVKLDHLYNAYQSALKAEEAARKGAEESTTNEELRNKASSALQVARLARDAAKTAYEQLLEQAAGKKGNNNGTLKEWQDRQDKIISDLYENIDPTSLYTIIDFPEKYDDHHLISEDVHRLYFDNAGTLCGYLNGEEIINRQIAIVEHRITELKTRSPKTGDDSDQPTEEQYTITWKNDDGTYFDSTIVNHGEIPVHEEPGKTNPVAGKKYTFTGWSPSLAEATSAAEYQATFSEETVAYDITWKNDDGTYINTTTVNHGEIPVHEEPEKTNPATGTIYTFTGWSPSLVEATSATEYQATFSETIDTSIITLSSPDTSNATDAKGPTTGADSSAAGGDGSAAGGDGSAAGGDGSAAGGNGSTTGGNGSTTGGNDSTTGGNDSTTGGNDSTTGGNDSTAGGNGSTAGGNGSTAGGNDEDDKIKEYEEELDWRELQLIKLNSALQDYQTYQAYIDTIWNDASLTAAREAYEAAVLEVEKWETAYETYLTSSKTPETEAYRRAKDNLEYAEEQYLSAKQALNDKVASNQNTIAGYNIDLADTWQQIEKAKQKLADLTGGEEAQILARVSGTIQTIDASPGDTKQKDDIIATIEAPDMGYSLSFSVTNDQANRLRPGDTATVSNFYWGTEIVATLNSIKIDQKNPQTNKLLTFDLSGNVTAGSELTLSVGQKSANYDIIIPSSSIRTDANGSFVLKVESKNSPLGNRYIARRVPVEVLASDDSNSAVSADLSFGDYVITTSSAPIKSGDLVRLAAS